MALPAELVFISLSKLLDIPQTKNLTRAIQIGVVSRGKGCAGFNTPAVYGSVKTIFTWIKETVEKNMKEKKFCPAKNLRM